MLSPPLLSQIWFFRLTTTGTLSELDPGAGAEPPPPRALGEGGETFSPATIAALVGDDSDGSNSNSKSSKAKTGFAKEEEDTMPNIKVFSGEISESFSSSCLPTTCVINERLQGHFPFLFRLFLNFLFSSLLLPSRIVAPGPDAEAVRPAGHRDGEGRHEEVQQPRNMVGRK